MKGGQGGVPGATKYRIQTAFSYFVPNTSYPTTQNGPRAEWRYPLAGRRRDVEVAG